jgi:hypothetical protein
MAKLKKDGTYKKSSSEGIQAAGGSRKPKTINKTMKEAMKIKRGFGKKI